jgi:hypothetical protein
VYTVAPSQKYLLLKESAVMPGLQIFNVNYALARKIFKPIIVCDISPNIAIQVINVEGANEQELLGSVKALTAWDMSNALTQRQLEKASK